MSGSRMRRERGDGKAMMRRAEATIRNMGNDLSSTITGARTVAPAPTVTRVTPPSGGGFRGKLVATGVLGAAAGGGYLLTRRNRSKTVSKAYFNPYDNAWVEFQEEWY